MKQALNPGEPGRRDQALRRRERDFHDLRLDHGIAAIRRPQRLEADDVQGLDHVFVSVGHGGQGLAVTIVGPRGDIEIARLIAHGPRECAVHRPVGEAVDLGDPGVARLETDEAGIGRRLARGAAAIGRRGERDHARGHRGG